MRRPFAENEGVVAEERVIEVRDPKVSSRNMLSALGKLLSPVRVTGAGRRQDMGRILEWYCTGADLIS